MRTIEQKRAESALQKATALEDRSEDFKQKYRSYVDRVGPAIVMNGLGQALATELAAGDDAHQKLYDNLSGWLSRSDGEYPNSGDLLSSIMKGDEAAYLRAQAEALAWLQWHKKFCRAFLPSGEGQG